jgi:gas vesicle protein
LKNSGLDLLNTTIHGPACIGLSFAFIMKKKMKKVICLILAGVAIGILVAPGKGSETWQKLKEGFNDWKDGAMDQINDMVSQGKDAIAKGSETAKNEVRETVDQW